MSLPLTVPPDLFLRLSRGDRDAFDEVHARYGTCVASIARRRLGPRLRARVETVDLTQEAWAAVACEAPADAFADEHEFLSWIAVVVERRALREARHWSRQCRKSEREVAGKDPATRPDGRAQRPSQIVLREETASRAMVALAELASTDRRVIVLRVLLGLSWSDVAVTLGIAEECAQMRYTRARRRLAALMR